MRKTQTKTIEKEIYNVWINQCAECDEISNIVVYDADIKVIDEIEKQIHKKYTIGSDGWNNEYKRIVKDVYGGNKIIQIRKYEIHAKIDTHKCCKCGGNY